MKKTALVLLSLLVLLSCEKMPSASNGLYINGQRVSRMDGHITAFGSFFQFIDYDTGYNGFLQLSPEGSSQSFWESGCVTVGILDHIYIDSWDVTGRALQIIKDFDQEKVHYWETPSGKILEELTLTSCPTGLFVIKEKEGTTEGTARIDVSFTLSNGDSYQIAYRGKVDTSHAVFYCSDID